MYTIYNDEMERRKKFLSEFQGHFLTCLFPGLGDLPPAFATQSPPLFDNYLPAVSTLKKSPLGRNLGFEILIFDSWTTAIS